MSRRSAAVLVALVSACLGALTVVAMTHPWSKAAPTKPGRAAGRAITGPVGAEAPGAPPNARPAGSTLRTTAGSPVRFRLKLLPSGTEVPIATVNGLSPTNLPDGGGEWTANVNSGGPVIVGTSDPRALVHAIRWDVPAEPPEQVTLFAPDADWARQQREMVLAVVDAESSQPLPGAFLEAGRHAPAGGRIAADRSGLLRLDPAFVAETMGWTFFLQSIYAPGYQHEDKDFLPVESEQWRAWTTGRPMQIGLRPFSSPRRRVAIRVANSTGTPLPDVLLEANAFPVSRIPPVRTTDDGTAELIDLHEDVRFLCVAGFIAGAPMARFVLQVPPDRAETDPIELVLPLLAEVQVALQGELDRGEGISLTLASTRVEYANLPAGGLGPYADLLPGLTEKQEGRLDLEPDRSDFRFAAPVGSEVSLAFLRASPTGQRQPVGEELVVRVAKEGNRIAVPAASLR